MSSDAGRGATDTVDRKEAGWLTMTDLRPTASPSQGAWYREAHAQRTRADNEREMREADANLRERAEQRLAAAESRLTEALALAEELIAELTVEDDCGEDGCPECSTPRRYRARLAHLRGEG